MQISLTKEIFIASPALNYNCRLFDKWLVAGLIFTEVHSLVNIVTSQTGVLCSYRSAFGVIYCSEEYLSLFTKPLTWLVGGLHLADQLVLQHFVKMMRPGPEDDRSRPQFLLLWRLCRRCITIPNVIHWICLPDHFKASKLCECIGLI